MPVPFPREGGAKWVRMATAAGAVLFLGAALTLSASRAILIGVVPAVGILLLLRFGWKGEGCSFWRGNTRPCVPWYQAAERFSSPDPYNYARLVMWKSAVRIFESHPFGVGLGGYQYYWFATQSPVEGAFAKYGKYATTAHNEFLEVLSGLGAVGFILFLLVLLVPVFLAVRGFRGIEEGRKWAAAGAAGGLLVSGIHAMFDFNFREIGLVVPSTRSSLARSWRGSPRAIHASGSPSPRGLSNLERRRRSCCSPSRRRPWLEKPLTGWESRA